MKSRFFKSIVLAVLVLSVFVLTVKSSNKAHAGDVDCPMIYQVYAHAVSHGKEKQFIELAEAYYECALMAAETSPDTKEVMAYLKAKDQVGDAVRTSSYKGQVKAHQLIVKAGFALVKGLQSYAKIPYISSLVRTAEHQRKLLRHPILKNQAIQRSSHVLGGLAVDVAFIGRKTSMKRMGQHARTVLLQTLGAAQADLLRIVVEPYCLHIELNRKNPVSAKMVEKRKAELVKQGILKRSKPGLVPHVNDYRSEKQWAVYKRNTKKVVRR